VQWYLAASKQGYASAENALGYMYSLGRGVKKDLDKAVLWFISASKHGLQLARENLGKLNAYRNTPKVTIGIKKKRKTHVEGLTLVSLVMRKQTRTNLLSQKPGKLEPGSLDVYDQPSL
jgi:TPR repeat protein